MDLDDILEVRDCSNATLIAIAERLERSEGPAHMVYRETELDELWRVIDLAMSRAVVEQANTEELTRLRGAVVVAHDLVGIDEAMPRAAEVLRAAVGQPRP
jgi:hypothetical protein